MGSTAELIAADVDPVAFERTFGAPVEQLAELVAKKEVTLPKLLELGVSSTAAMIASDIDPVPRWGV